MAFNFDFNFSPKPKTSLLDRAVNNLSDIATGAIPGALQMGHTVGKDMVAALPFTKNQFGTPGMLGEMGKGLWSSSIIPPLMLGNPREAFKRASDRPVDALLDLSLAAPLTTGAAKLGMKSSLTRDVAAPVLGYERVTDAAAPTIMPTIRDSQQSSLPSYLEIDGSLNPTREYIGGFKEFGGDLFARRTGRTLNPQTRPKLDNDTGAVADFEEQLAPLKSPETMQGRVPTLGEDKARDLVIPRSTHEMYASLGDSIHDLTSKIPDNLPLSHARRKGVKMFGAERLAENVEKDQAEQQFADYESPAIEKLKSELGIDDEAAKSRLASTVDYESAMLNADELSKAIRDWDPSIDFADVDPQTLFGMTVEDAFKNFGFRMHHKDNYDWANPSNDQWKGITVGQLLKDDHVQIGRKGENGPDSPIETRLYPRHHRDRLAKYGDQRNAMQGSFHEAVDHLLKQGIKPFLVATNSGKRVDINLEDLQNGRLLDEIANRHDWDIDFEDFTPPPRQVPGNAEEFVGSLPDYEGQVIPEVQNKHKEDATKLMKERISAYVDARSKARTLNEKHNYFLNQYKMLGDNPVLEARGDSKNFGVVDRLRKIEAEALPDDLKSAKEIQDYIKFQTQLRNRQEPLVKEQFPEELVNDKTIEDNKHRLSDFVRGGVLGDKIVDGDAQYIPMHPDPGNRSDTYNKNVEEATTEKYPGVNKEPGDPYTVFLDGKWSNDNRAILNDFAKNRHYVTSARIYERMQQDAVEIDDAQLEEMKNLGRVTDEAEMVGGKKKVAPYTVITDGGPMYQKFEEMKESLRSLGLLTNKADPSVAASADEIIEALDKFNPTKTDIITEGQNYDNIGTGKKYIINTETYRAAMNELRTSQKALEGVHHMFKDVTDVWKWTVLHGRFLSWMRNNFVGAHAMVTMAGGPAAYTREVMRRMEDPNFKEMNQIAHQNMPEVFATGSSSVARDFGKSEEGTLKRKIEDNIIDPMSDVNSNWADNPAREIRLFQLMHDQLEEIKKIEGYDGPLDLTPEVVEKFMNDEVLRSELSKRTRTDMVDFSDMSEKEKLYIRSVFPFWAWMRGSTKAGARVMADSPERVWTAAEISEIGQEDTEEDLGHFSPDFAHAWWNPGGEEGNVINTAGWNPYGTGIDFMMAGASLVPNIPLPGTDDEIKTGMSYRAFGSENPLSMMHPLIGGPIEGLTGKNVFFGTPIEQGSTGGGVITKMLGGLPLPQYTNRMLTNQTGPDATTQYSRWNDTGNFLFGVPVRDPNPGNVRSRGVDELNERYQSPLAWRELQ